MLKERVERLMREERIEGIAVEALGYQEILKQSRAYEEIVQRYEVIACIGNMNPGICSRFYDLSTILSEENLNVFADYLRQNMLLILTYIKVCAVLKNFLVTRLQWVSDFRIMV